MNRTPAPPLDISQGLQEKLANKNLPIKLANIGATIKAGR